MHTSPDSKKWFYPVSQEMDEPDEHKLKNLLVISFVIQKKRNDTHQTNFRAKAPIDMELGELFTILSMTTMKGTPTIKLNMSTKWVSHLGGYFTRSHFFLL